MLSELLPEDLAWYKALEKPKESEWFHTEEACSTVGNIGPALGSLGPSANYGALPAALKWWYCFAMLAGRLEIYTMLILAGRLFVRRRS